MSAPHGDGFSEFAEELKLLAEAVLERVEPVLRRSAAQGQPDWSACSWCPVCAAAALVRGEHHDVVAAIADHGTAIVTVLREALAGVPVDPLMPDDEDAESGDERSARSHPGDRRGDASRSSDQHSGKSRTGDLPTDATRSGDERGDSSHSSAPRTDASPDQRTTAPPSTDAPEQSRRPAGSKRSGYVGIPVTIKA
ncbi:hypothetical protein [Nocardia bhagyanarayanae]|nr:hypothetical protein [Nocardia bhagyanarayanae]